MKSAAEKTGPDRSLPFAAVGERMPRKDTNYKHYNT